MGEIEGSSERQARYSYFECVVIAIKVVVLVADHRDEMIPHSTENSTNSMIMNLRLLHDLAILSHV